MDGTPDPYIAPCLRQAGQQSYDHTRTGFTEAYAETVSRTVIGHNSETQNRTNENTHTQTYTQTHTHTHGQGKVYMPCRHFMAKRFCSHRLTILYTCAKCCQSISRVDAMVIANVDGRTYGHTNGLKTGSLYHTMPEACVTTKL